MLWIIPTPCFLPRDHPSWIRSSAKNRRTLGVWEFGSQPPGPSGHGPNSSMDHGSSLPGVREFQPPSRCWRNIQMIRILTGKNSIKNGIFPFFSGDAVTAAPGYNRRRSILSRARAKYLWRNSAVSPWRKSRARPVRLTSLLKPLKKWRTSGSLGA